MVTVTKAPIGKSGSSLLWASWCSILPSLLLSGHFSCRLPCCLNILSTACLWNASKALFLARKTKGGKGIHSTYFLLPPTRWFHLPAMKEWKYLKVAYLKAVVCACGSEGIYYLYEVSQFCPWSFHSHLKFLLVPTTFKTKYNKGRKTTPFYVLNFICLDSSLKYKHYLKTKIHWNLLLGSGQCLQHRRLRGCNVCCLPVCQVNTFHSW